MSNPQSAMTLTKITGIDDIRKLRDLYLKDWPQNCVGYYCLDNFYKWKMLDENLKHFSIYTVREDNGDGECNDDGLYVIVDRYQLFIGSLGPAECKNLNLTNALEQLDWSTGFKVSSFRECHRPSVLSVVESKRLQVEYDSLTLMYYMPRDEAIKLEICCPKGFYVKRLSSATDAAVIDTLWPNRHQGSLFLIKRLIDWNPNAGVYVEGSNELVAWCLRLQGGFLGALQVKDNYKRLGLGSVVTRATARYIAQDVGDDITALVNESNKPSRGMFEKMGFTVTDRCYWLRTFPTVDNFAWPEGE